MYFSRRQTWTPTYVRAATATTVSKSEEMKKVISKKLMTWETWNVKIWENLNVYVCSNCYIHFQVILLTWYRDCASCPTGWRSALCMEFSLSLFSPTSHLLLNWQRYQTHIHIRYLCKSSSIQYKNTGLNLVQMYCQHITLYVSKVNVVIVLFRVCFYWCNILLDNLTSSAPLLGSVIYNIIHYVL